MQNQTYAAHFRPQIKREAFFYDIVLVIGASIFIALSAQIAFNVPFSPVPITPPVKHSQLSLPVVSWVAGEVVWRLLPIF